MKRLTGIMLAALGVVVVLPLAASADHVPAAMCSTPAFPLAGTTACGMGSSSDPLATVEVGGSVDGIPGLVGLELEVYELEGFTVGDLVVSCEDSETLIDVITGTADGHVSCEASLTWGSTGMFWCELRAQGNEGGGYCRATLAHS